MKNMRCFITITLFLSNLIFNQAFAESNGLNVEPYVVKGDDPNLKTGSVYYTSSKKDDVLLKGSIWGAVQFPGVHYLPLGTRFLDALSIAGGPIDIADKDNVLLSTKTKNGLEVKNISVYQALSDKDFNPYIQADDIIVVKERHTYQNWNLALQAGTFIISAIILGMMVEDRSKR